MQGCRKRKLLKNKTHLREVPRQLFHDWLGRLTVRTLQVTKLRNQDRWGLGATTGTIGRFQFSPRWRIGIGAKGNHLTHNRSLPFRWKKDVIGSVLVDGH